MKNVSLFRPEDVKAVANLHRRVFHRKNKPASESLIDYYRKLFFENPWKNDELPSFVWRDSDGSINGFMGVVPRPMLYEQRQIRVAVGHRLMVPDDAPNATFVAARLVRACVGGNQDLFISDGAAEQGRRMVTAAGGVAVPQYSIRWDIPVRPLSCLLNSVSHGRKIQPLAHMVEPFARAADRLVLAKLKILRASVSDGISIEPMNDKVLLESIEKASAKFPLRPVYDLSSLRWMLSFIGADTGRGVLNGFALRRKGRLLGSCLYYANQMGGYEVITIAGVGMPATRELLLSLLATAYREGATHVFGRFEPRLAEPLWELRCHLKPNPGCWTVIHSSDHRMSELVEMGKIFLSNLEAELWLGAPMRYND